MCPQANSNRRFGLERAASWSTRRWGQKATCTVAWLKRRDFTSDEANGQDSDETCQVGQGMLDLQIVAAHLTCLCLFHLAHIDRQEAFQGNVDRGEGVAFDVRLHQHMIQAVVREDGRRIVDDDLLGLLIQLNALVHI